MDGGVEPSLALDAEGRPHVAYGGNLAGTYEYGLKYARHDGSAWQIEMVDDSVSPGWHNSLALDSLGNPHIAYHDPGEALMYAHYYSGSWHIQAVESGADLGEKASLALDSANLPHIAYWDYTNHRIRYARRVGADWHIETVVTFVGTGYDTSLSFALDTGNQPHVSYYDYDLSLLRYAHKVGGIWQSDTVDPEDYRGQGSSLVIDAQGHPRISYSGDGLMYARFDGAVWRITQVDNDWSAGSRSSLALDRYGHPHIGYSVWAYPDHELRYARFDGFDWQIEILDTAAETSRFESMSLALDGDSQPHIVYQDLQPDDLKYAMKGLPHIVSRIYVPL
ncbi:MAG: hypothetical protein EHM56_07480, partial [Chloroflexi bacterium]